MLFRSILITPDGEEETKIYIVCHEEDESDQDIFENNPSVSICVKYKGKEFMGCGKDYLWADAFANLQKLLPDDVLLKCCMTCRHGNMCPYGNEPGKVFCAKDVIITSKEDVCELFDSETYRMDDKIKNVTDSCCEYDPQSKGYYIYNDYSLYYEK